MKFERMTARFLRRQQKGALSLRLTALCIAIASGAMMAALFSMRYERNLFSEMWDSAKKSTPKWMQQLTQQVTQAVPGAPSTEIVKCKVNGQWVYSNSECKGSNVQKIAIRESSGFEAPKIAPPSNVMPEQVREKMMERAIEGVGVTTDK